MTALGRFWLILCTIFLYVPIVALIVFSFDASGLMAFPVTALTFHWYVELFHNIQMQEGLLVSFLVAQPVAALATLLGLCAATGLTAKQLRYRAWFGLLLIVPFLVPKAVLAMAETMLLSRVGFPRGLINLVSAEALVTMPFALVILFSVLARLDPRLEEAARDLGATPMQVFWRITLPLLRSGLVISYSLCAILSLADLTLSTYLAGHIQPLSVIVASAFRTKLSPDLNALQVVLLLSTVIIAVLTTVGRRRFQSRKTESVAIDRAAHRSIRPLDTAEGLIAQNSTPMLPYPSTRPASVTEKT